VLEHVCVQKWVVGSPSDEQSVDDMLPEQSERLAQYLPTPWSLPVSPGLPHVDIDASAAGGASGVFGSELPPHATVTAMTAEIAVEIGRLM
jgi:hypothetical protein